MKLITSSFYDKNINHIFHIEIKAIFDLINNHKTDNFIFFAEKSGNNPWDKWRMAVISKMVCGAYDKIEDLPKFDGDSIRLSFGDWILNPGLILNEEIESEYSQISEIVRSKFADSAENFSPDIVLIQRKHSRTLFDQNSQARLESVLAFEFSKHGITFTTVYFDDAPFDYQAKILRNAKVLIGAHGAGLTNLFLLPKGTHVMEVSFRNYWFCDPVCDDHFHGLLQYRQKCSHGLRFFDYYHKTDFINLSKIFKINHIEIPICDAGNFQSRNPIDVSTIFVDGEKIARNAIEIVRGSSPLIESTQKGENLVKPIDIPPAWSSPEK
jgi:hypothetical protein